MSAEHEFAIEDIAVGDVVLVKIEDRLCVHEFHALIIEVSKRFRVLYLHNDTDHVQDRHLRSRIIDEDQIVGWAKPDFLRECLVSLDQSLLKPYVN